jgi:cytoskeletal protein CcmA (bactofilin family)
LEGQPRNHLNLSGIGSAPGGTYQNVSIQGMGKVQGDLECVDCSLEGMVTINGSVKAQTIRIQGKASVKGDVSGEEVNLEGHVSISGKCDADKFVGTGAFNIDGLLNADEISIQVYGPSRVREIGAETIRIEKESGPSFIGRLKKLIAEIIEGDDIYLENTKARVVRGNRVVIGAGCNIDLVEYRVEFEQHKSARVGDQKRL